MRNFNDASGKSWAIVVNIGQAIKVRDTLGIDLLQPELGDPPLLERFGTDDIMIAKIIACLLQGQFETNGIDENKVYELFDGKTINDATNAFYDELISFFQSRGRRDRSEMIAKQRSLIEAGVTVYESRIKKIDLDRKTKEIEKAADSILGDYYTISEAN